MIDCPTCKKFVGLLNVCACGNCKTCCTCEKIAKEIEISQTPKVTENVTESMEINFFTVVDFSK